jgi:hypothetical protein
MLSFSEKIKATVYFFNEDPLNNQQGESNFPDHDLVPTQTGVNFYFVDKCIPSL